VQAKNIQLNRKNLNGFAQRQEAMGGSLPKILGEKGSK